MSDFDEFVIPEVSHEDEIRELRAQIAARDRIIAENFRDAVALFAGMQQRRTVILSIEADLTP